MSKQAWRPSSRYSLSRISLFSLLVFGAIYGTLLARNFGATHAATALCEGQPGIFTMVAPASVTPGQSFKLTNITGSANTNIATVNATTLTYAVSGATPASFSETWSGGPVHGDYTADYNDYDLTASGAAGSQISVKLIAIQAQITIGVTNTSITCSVENGQLTANNPGETLNLTTVNIVAPAVNSTPSSSSSSGSTSKKGTPVAKAPSNSSGSNPAPATNSPTSSTTSPANTSATNGQDISISVQDSKGQPVKGARVVIDSLPIVHTNASGKVTLASVSTGSHNLSVSYNNHTLSRVIQVNANSDGKVLGIQVQMPPPSYATQKIIAGSVVALLALGLGGWRFKHWRNKRRNMFGSPLSSKVVSSTQPITTPIPLNELSRPSIRPTLDGPSTTTPPPDIPQIPKA